jgi:hypothetical protein
MLAARLTELVGQKAGLEAARQRDETEREAKRREIHADETQQSIERLGLQLEAAHERLQGRQQRWRDIAGHLKTLAGRSRSSLRRSSHICVAKWSSSGACWRAIVLLRMASGLSNSLRNNRREAERERLGKELKSLRDKRVLIPSEFVGHS